MGQFAEMKAFKVGADSKTVGELQKKSQIRKILGYGFRKIKKNDAFIIYLKLIHIYK